MVEVEVQGVSWCFNKYDSEKHLPFHPTLMFLFMIIRVIFFYFLSDEFNFIR